MWHQQLLSKVLARDPIWADQPTLGEVAQRFTQTLCPAIIQHFGGLAALGGTGAPLTEDQRADLPEGARPLPAEDYERFSRTPDQSLAAHLLNGIFAGFRLAALLPDALNWSEQQWNLWVLGFTLHDYGKACRVDVPAARLDAARALCRKLGAQLNFASFFPAWGDYLDDIVYLAQNTQKMRGANKNLRDYALHLHPATLDQLCLLASFADVLVHITEPRDVAQRTADDRASHDNLRVTLQTLLGRERAPRLAYHQIAETRGLLTNLLHNATQEAFLRQGFRPYLYFADGVVYLAPQDGQAQVTTEEVVERTWQSIRDALTQSESFGLGRDGKGIKIAPPLYQFLNSNELIDAGRAFALGIKNNIADKRLEKYGVADTHLLADLRVDWLAEFLAYLKRNIAEVLLPRAKDLSAFLLRQLGLDGFVSVAETERNEGGVPLGWYYAAAHYITRHPALDPGEMEALMRQIGEALLAELRRQGLTEQGSSVMKDALASYVAHILDIDGAGLTGDGAAAQFANELTSYLNNKATNRPVCSLCSSPYESEEQTVTVVLFKPQQYSNKNRLGGSRVVRGVCPLCSLEMLLRQAKQGAPGGKFQDEQAIYLAIYPAYFFTPETAELLQEYQKRLEDLNLYLGADSLLGWLRKASQDGRLDLEHLVEYEHFLSDEDDEALLQKKRRTIRVPRDYSLRGYSEKALSGFALLPLTPGIADATDTQAWVLPAFYALALPLLLNVKVVASASFVPLYTTAANFPQTVLLDGMHPTVQFALRSDRFRIDEIIPALKRLLSFYDLHADVFAEGYDAHWGQLGAVVRDVLTDSYNVFAYYDRKRRVTPGEQKGASKARTNGASEQTREGIPIWDRKKYLDIYDTLGGEKDMGIVGKLVDSYAAFYQAQFDKLDSSYSVLKPLALAIDTTVNSSPKFDADDLIEMVSGEINHLMELIRREEADGWDPIARDKTLGSWGERLETSRNRIRGFAELFIQEVFLKRCDGDRAMLREQSNRLRSAARFYYLAHYATRTKVAAAPDKNE